jgi:twitching motility protein PilT
MVLEAVISQQLIPTADRHHRVAAFEVMLMSVAIKNLIREAKTFQIESMIQTSKKSGMITMDDALYELCMMGHITSEQAINFAQDSVALEKKIKVF